MPAGQCAHMTDSVPTAFVPRLDKSGPAVWMALDGENRVAFEAEFRAVLTEVAESFDVDRLTQVVWRWWPRAVLDAHPDPIAQHMDSASATVISQCLPRPRPSCAQR